MTKFTMFVGEDWKLPIDKIHDYAAMMYATRRELSKVPTPSLDFFKDRLTTLLNTDSQLTAVNVIGYYDEKPMAWGHASFGSGKCLLSDVYCYVDPFYRNRGYGTKIIKTLLSLVPERVTEFSISAFDEASNYVERTFHSKVVNVEKRYAALIDKLDVVELQKLLPSNYQTNKFDYHMLTTHDLAENQDMKEILRIKYKGRKNIDELMNKFHSYVMRAKKAMGTKQLIAYVKRNGHVIAYSRVVHYFEKNTKTAIKMEFGTVSHAYSEIENTLNVKLLEFLKKNTEVSHWIFGNLEENGFVMEHFNTKYLYTVYTHKKKLR